MSRPAVFLDRDGAITREVDYLRDVKQLRLLPRAAAAIRELNQSGYAVVIVSNQSGIARGLLTEDDLAHIHRVMLARLARQGARLDAIYYCPHLPDATVAAYRKRCHCRKPAAGMLRRAARELDLDLARSYVIGDRARDLAPGRTLRCRTILVRTGYGAQEESGWEEEWRPDHVAANLRHAAQWMLKREIIGVLRELTLVAESEFSRLSDDPCARP
jgi:D-glycero-D-manno-heptose 1,7-bisphosphate phosphatase